LDGDYLDEEEDEEEIKTSGDKVEINIINAINNERYRCTLDTKSNISYE
jgi:hypothetical protein